MAREKELFQRLGITKTRRIAACIAEGIYILIFLIAAVWKKSIQVEGLLNTGVVIMAISLNYMACIKNQNGELEFSEILKYYPVDGTNVYKMIRGIIVKFTLVHWCVSLIMVYVLGKTEQILYTTVVVLLTGFFTNLGYWIGYGRAVKEERGRDASFSTSIVVCFMFAYPVLIFGIAACRALL
ncbi:MAG: hypothetical protein K2N51_11520 [Lachnospiraceae bacterium]|nr:hypothetical protein [Lachnospiraceae bacterium]